MGVVAQRPGIHSVEKSRWGWWKKTKGGYREDLKREYRSSWEANIHRLLNWMKQEGIPFTGKHVSYETVYVEFNVRRGGPMGYHPDFVLYLSSPIVIGNRKYSKAHIEISGFRDRKKIEKMKRLKEDYGDKNGIISIEIVSEVYYMLEDSYSAIVPNWELSGKRRKTENATGLQ